MTSRKCQIGIARIARAGRLWWGAMDSIRDLTRIELARVLKPEIRKRAKENMKFGGESGSSGRQKLANPTTTKDELAKAADVSPEQFRKGEYVLENADPETLGRLLRGRN